MRRILYSLMASALLAPVLAFAQAAGAAPQQPPLTFRAEANFVEVDAFVSDDAGNPVADLRAADFELLEDGKPQMVTAFSHVNIPIERDNRPLFSPTSVEADVATNAGLDGRIYLIVLDDLHIDLVRGPRVKASLHRFFERNFGANDLAAVVFTSGRSADAQDFTNNTRLLLAAVDKFSGRKLRSATLERIDEYNRQQNGGFGQPGAAIADPEVMERGRNARNMMESVQKLSEFMANLHGRRKALLLISEGVDYDIYNVFDNNGVSSDIIDATRNAVAAATRGNVSIYTIDPRGLETPGADLIESTGAAGADPGLNLGVQASVDEVRLSQDSLRTLADQTGGFAVVNQNNVDASFDRIVRDNSSYYVLGYYPSNDKRDGRFRTINVRVTRPGVMVRARRGYVAPRGGRAPAPARPSNNPADDALKAAVESPLPTSGIPMRLFAAPYKGTAPNAAVTLAVELGIGALKFTEKNGTVNDALTLVTMVTDTDAKVRVNEKASIDMTLMPATYQRAQALGFRVTSAVNLPPGRYQVRISAADSAGVAGSVVRTLEVPDFYKTPLVMSGLAVLSRIGGFAPTARVKDDPVGILLMKPPTTARTFTRDDQLTLFAEIYENQQNAPAHKVDITTEVRADGGRVVFRSAQERSSTELQGRGGYGYTVDVPLKDVAPGVYVVHVEGRSRGLKSDAAVVRESQIEVR